MNYLVFLKSNRIRIRLRNTVEDPKYLLKSGNRSYV